MVIPLSAYLALLGALGLERIVELRISMRNARRAFACGAVEAGIRHYPVMVVFHTLFVFSCAGEALILRRIFPGIIGWLALGGAALSQALRYWAVWTLGERWNTRIIVIPGAAPVASGPYRFVRHPNYLAVTMEMICIPMIYGCWLTALVFSIGNLLILRLRIKAEEAALGPGYQAAFDAVPRLIPRLRY